MHTIRTLRTISRTVLVVIFYNVSARLLLTTVVGKSTKTTIT